MSAPSAVSVIHNHPEQCQHVVVNAENSQNCQFGRKKELIIPAPQDEIVEGVNGWTPKIPDCVQHKSSKTHNRLEEDRGVTPARAKAGRREIHLGA